MNDSAAVQAAARDLVQLRQQVDATRGVLTSLLQQVVEAANRLDSSRTALLEANEHLVIAALRAQADAEAAARALDVASRTAQFDALTQLPNRLLLLDRFAQALANAKRHGCRMALLFVDLDKFKQINDTLGHAVGDEVLKLAAQCLGASVRAADTVSRHGGDEFLILLAEVSQASDAARVADKVIAALGADHRVAGHAIRLTASIGIGIYPDDGEEADTLIHRADAAMYRAKRRGPGSFAFHGNAPTSLQQPQPALPEPLPQLLVHSEQALAEHERHYVRLRNAGECRLPAAAGAPKRQAAARTQQRQADLLALLVHELRDPLTPLRKAVTLLGRARSRGPLPRRVQAVIERQVAHLSRLLGDLLDLSSGDTGPPGLERRQVDMARVVEEAVERCRPAIDGRRQRLHIETADGATEVHGDPHRLAQMLDNLLDHASRHTREGGDVGLSVTVVEGAMMLVVSGDGVAADADAAVPPPAFEPVGQGPGLAAVRECIAAHCGSLVAGDASGYGRRFVVMLPLAPAPGGVNARRLTPPPARRATSSGSAGEESPPPPRAC